MDHPYLFLWIWEDNSLHAFRGFAVRQGVREAATYNEKTQAITVHAPVTLSPDTRILVLIEASTGDTLLFSELHPVSDLPWSYAIPDLKWQGVYRAGPQVGATGNMVINENRFLRGPVEVLRVQESGAVTIRFAGETFSLQPGEGHQVVKMVDPDRQLYSRLVVYHQGEWNMERVTLAFPPGAGEVP